MLRCRPLQRDSCRKWTFMLSRLLFAAAMQAVATTLYVDPHGNNANPGSAASPWATPGFASRQLSPGDSLIIRSGTYRLREFDADILIPPSGTPDRWITIRGQSEPRPILAGGHNLFAAVIMGGAHYVRLENLEITHDAEAAGADAHFRTGISISGSPAGHLAFTELYIHHMDESGLDAQDVEYMDIVSCRFEYCGFGCLGGPAGLHGGWRNVSIRDCDLAYSGHYYQGGDGGHRPYDRPDGFGIEPSAGPVDIMDCRVVHNYGDGIDSKADHTTITGCMVANNSCDGVKLWGDDDRVIKTLIYGRGDGSGTPTPWSPVVISSRTAGGHFYFTNVTVDDSLGHNYLFHAQYDHDIPINLYLRNCIFCARGGSSAIWLRNTVQLTAEYNLFYMPRCPVLVEHGAASYDVINLVQMGTGNRNGNPGFIKPAWGETGDYRLRPTSPAIDSGDPDPCFADGDGSRNDMGAFSYLRSTGVRENPRPLAQQPDDMRLEQNYPNPFHTATRIGFTLSHASVVRIEIFDLQGRKREVLAHSQMTNGYHELRFLQKDLPAGTYFYRLYCGDNVQTKKMIILPTP